MDAADGWWTEANDYECFGFDGVSGGDLDGDGLDDAVLLTYGISEAGVDGALTFISGREYPSFGEPRTNEVTLSLSDGSSIPGTGQVKLLGDLDGDGCDEVAFDGVNGFFVVRGPDFASADGARSVDVGVFVDDGYSPSIHGPLGDWNGDGALDIALYGDDDYTYRSEGQIRILRAPDLSASTVDADDLEIGSFYGDRSSAGAGAILEIIPDIDGDGRTDLTGFLLMENEYEGGWCVFPSSRFLPGAQDARDVAWCHKSLERVGYGMPGGDFDGDGRTDLIFGADNGAEERGRVQLILGWDLPWDDPHYW